MGGQEGQSLELNPRNPLKGLFILAFIDDRHINAKIKIGAAIAPKVR